MIIEGIDRVTFGQGWTILDVMGTQVMLHAGHPAIQFHRMFSFLAWVAKGCPRLRVTSVHYESGTVTIGTVREDC